MFSERYFGPDSDCRLPGENLRVLGGIGVAAFRQTLHHRLSVECAADFDSRSCRKTDHGSFGNQTELVWITDQKIISQDISLSNSDDEIESRSHHEMTTAEDDPGKD